MQVKSFAIWANAEKKQVPALVQSTIKWANDNNLEVYLADRLKSIDVGSEVSYFSSQNPPEVDFLLCFGGDGTLISGVRIFSDPSVPVLGVHLGGLGFLAQITPEVLIDKLESVKNNEFKIQDRLVLSAKISGNEDSLPDVEDEEEVEEEERPTGKKGGLGGEHDDIDGARESVTEHNAHNNEDQFIDENAVIRTYFNFNDRVDELDKVLYSYKTVLKDWKDWENLELDEDNYRYKYETRAREMYNEKSELVRDYIRNKNKKIISHMAREFEMRQTAMRSLKARTGKSGDLDMNKLAKYQIVDDIFKQVTYLPDGKNHGVNVMLDWSGSICNEVRDLLEQSIILAEFCRLVQIPYRVYLFSDHITEDAGADDYSWRSSSGRLIEMLSNEQSGREHQQALKILSAIYFNFWKESVNIW